MDALARGYDGRTWTETLGDRAGVFVMYVRQEPQSATYNVTPMNFGNQTISTHPY